MRLGAARLQRFLPCAQRILLRRRVIGRDGGPTGGWRTGDRRVSAALWPHLALRLLPRFLAPAYDSRAAAAPATRRCLQRRAAAIPIRTPKSLKMVASIIDAIATQDQWTRRPRE